jgi:O-antigen ligase
MVALSVIPIRAETGLDTPEGAVGKHTPMVVGVCLFALLIYCTTAGFVKAAWQVQTFQIGVFALLAAYLLADIRGTRRHGAGGWMAWLIYLTPVWGVVQLMAHTTASSVETREAVLRWGAMAGVFYLSQVIARTRTARHRMLTAFLVFATAMAVLCVTQLFTSDGLVLWTFPTGYTNVYATFPSYDRYAQFVELALPIALWRAVREGWHSWWYGLSGGLLYASTIGSASRTGTALCTAELVAVLLIRLIKLRAPATAISPRAAIATLAMVPVLAAAFTLAVGWERVWLRFQQNKDLYAVRREYLVAALDMAKRRPLIGYGLDTFPLVYPRYAIKDYPFYANHAHNDWAEFAADGGVPFLLLVLIPFAAAIPTAIRNPWGIGLLAILLHACVEFPFPRPAVSCWMFALLGVLWMARASSRDEQLTDDLALEESASELSSG